MTAEISRHLLFGLIALQVGLIDQAQLVAAFQAWVRDKARPLADHLADRGGPGADGRAAIEAMVALHVKTHGGDTEKSLASIPAGRSTRERLAALGDHELTGSVARLANSLTEPDADLTTTYSVGSATSDGQRFRVLRPHARGGLGAVFVALDAELHREVALKQILESHADDPVSRQRFVMEAEITGGLEHPGIVPVYGLGTYGDGRPYYAMRFIRGNSLKEAIEQFHRSGRSDADPGARPLELRKLLRRFMDVCNAIEYAHSRGVLHRDLKPGNVIVGKHGETLVVDWGLAKALGKSEPTTDVAERTLMPSSGSVLAETLPGQAMGTPAYMSPEQARGDLDALGPRSDVYSLGATLYCLLTGKSPFEGPVAEVLRSVERGEFHPPRALDPSIDRALEAVCLKAMATKPDDRYSSCRAMAEDVERWTADEPVSARPDDWLQALARWSRRYRSLTRAAVVGLVVLALSSTIAALVINGARDRERAARIQAGINEQRANANFLMARQAVNDYLTRVSENTLLKVQPSRDLRELRKRLLEDALKFYRSFIDQHRDDPQLKRELARAYARVATITDEIGTRPEALAGHARALEIRRGLAEADPGDTSLLVNVAETLIAIASIQRSMGTFGEANDALEEARRLLESLVRSHPESREALLQLSKVCQILGAVHKVSERWDRAGPLFDRAQEILKRLVEIDPSEPKYLRALAWSTYQTGNLLSDPRRKDPDFQRAQADYDEALSLQRRLIAGYAGEPDYPMDMAQCYMSLASLSHHGDGDDRGAVRYLEAALELQKKVVATHPTVTLYLLDVSSTYYNLAYYCSLLPGKPDVLKWYRESIAVAERLVDLDPENVNFENRLGRAVTNLGFNLAEQGKPDQAIQEFLRAIDIHRRVLSSGSDLRSHRAPMVVALLNLADVRVTQGKAAEGLAIAREASPMIDGIAECWRDYAAIHAMAAGHLDRDPAERQRCLDLAMDFLRRAVESGEVSITSLQTDRRFATLARTTEFQALVYDSIFPADPFSTAR